MFCRLWLLPTWCLLGLSRLLILFVPFRVIAAHLGDSHSLAAWVPLANLRQEERARRIAQTVRLASRVTPWQANCLPQALAAAFILRLYRIPYALFMGVSRSADASTMTAHAWVQVGRVTVSGGNGFNDFTVVGSFISASLTPPQTSS